MIQPALEFEDVWYRYPWAKEWALRGLSLAVSYGTILALIGPTGSGKSTLLKVARGLCKEYGGEFQGVVRVGGGSTSGLDAHQLGSKVAIVFQNPAYQLHQPRVIDEIMSAPMYQGLPWAECISRAEQCAEAILGGRFLTSNPSTLSSGEQQRVALAASLAMRADVVLLDEPFSYLDVSAAADFLQVIANLRATGKAVIIATHDLDLIVNCADEIAVINEGRLVACGRPTEILYSRQIQGILGRPLFAQVGERLFGEGRLKELPLSWQDLVRDYVDVGHGTGTTQRIDRQSEDARDVVLETHAVSYQYPGSGGGVEDVSLVIHKGEIVGIIGGNGSGKTTLAKLVLGLLSPSRGCVAIFGERVRRSSRLARRIGYASQDPNDMLFETTVLRECSFGPASLGDRDPRGRVIPVLSSLGLTKYLERDPRSLSGGEQRLLTIADVLANDPDIVVLDEPEFGLDLRAFRVIEAVLRDLRAAGKTVLLITQRLEATALLCDQLVLMSKGKVLATGAVIEICSNAALMESAGLKCLPLFTLLRRAAGVNKGPMSEEELVRILALGWASTEADHV